MRYLTRLFWLAALVALGALPAAVFLVWAEAMARSIGFAQMVLFVLGGPRVALSGQPLWVEAAFDFGLILAFGAVHSALAQEPVQERLARLIGAAHVRAFYVIVTGVCLLGVINNWQVLGATLWHWVPDSPRADRIGAALYYALMALCGRVIVGTTSLEFLGFAPVWRGAPEAARTSGQAVLKESGAYAWVRHPGYVCLLAGFLCANRMTLDRFVIFAGAFAYLLVGIPIEERKLVAQFGDAYRDYRRRVPALIPLLRYVQTR